MDRRNNALGDNNGRTLLDIAQDLRACMEEQEALLESWRKHVEELGPERETIIETGGGLLFAVRRREAQEVWNFLSLADFYLVGKLKSCGTDDFLYMRRSNQ